jgi:hypothetical protein
MPPIMLPCCHVTQRSASATRQREQAARQAGAKGTSTHPSPLNLQQEQDMLNSNASEINPETAGLCSSTAGIIGNRQSAIGNRQNKNL